MNKSFLNIKRQSKILFSSDLFKSTSTLVSGTIIAQLIPILLQPLLRRFFSPEIFGVYAVYLSLVGILITVTSFKYELAIVLPKKDKEAANILILSQFHNLVFNLIILIVIVLLKEKISIALNIPPKYSLFVYFIPLGSTLYNLYISINYWLIRQKAFKSISINKILRRSSEGLSQILFLAGKINLGLLLGDIIGHITNIFSGIFQIKKKHFSIKTVSWKKLMYVRKKHNEFPRYNLLPSFMSACSYLLPAILINKFFSSENAGYFDLSKLLLSIPLALIATSVSNVLLQRISEKFKSKRSIKQDILFISALVFSIAFFEVIIILIWSNQLFTFFFGDEWIISGKISKLMVWSYAFNFLTASFSNIFIALKRIKLMSLWQVLYFGGILCLTIFKNASFFTFIKIYVGIEVFCYSLMTALILYVTISYERKCHST